MRTVSLRLADLQHATIPLGFAGENLHTVVQFDSKRVFDDYPDAVPSLTVKPPVGDPYPAVTLRDGDIVSWTVNDSDLVNEGRGELQLAFIEDGVVVKSYICRTRIERSIIPTGEVPTPIENWVIEANEALGTISGAVERAEDAAEEAEAAKGQAESAQAAAEQAQSDAEAAQRAAEAARSGAESARNQAQTAKAQAEAARDAAQGYAGDAYADANRAEQAANNLGWMEMEIVDGHLIYRKTELVDIDFELVDGHLIVEVA